MNIQYSLIIFAHPGAVHGATGEAGEAITMTFFQSLYPLDDAHEAVRFNRSNPPGYMGHAMRRDGAPDLALLIGLRDYGATFSMHLRCSRQPCCPHYCHSTKCSREQRGCPV